MLYKGTADNENSEVREFMFQRLDSKSDVALRRMGGEGTEHGQVVSVGADEVIVKIDGENTTVKFMDILNFY